MKIKKVNRRLAAAFILLQLAMPMTGAHAENSDTAAGRTRTSGTSTMETVIVKGSGQNANNPFLPDVQGTKIYSGKKTSRIRLDELPEITNNNFRQALIKTPGLIVSEETTPLVSIGYRGLDPNRAQFIQVLKDGVPIHADMFGYPEAYYVPPLQTIQEIEFIKGGAGLMYGPQPGGALNFVTHDPVLNKKVQLKTENVFGTDNYFSTYEALTGTIGPVGYLGYFHERQGDGFRKANSDFEVISGGLKTVINQTGDSRLTLNYDEYHEEHGEPGGLTRAQFDRNADVSTRQFDRFRLERNYGNLKYEKEFSDQTQFDFLVYGGHYRRYSKRQNGGGFGTVPTGTTNSIEEQDFYNIGIEPRLRHNYELFGEEHTLTAGVHNFMSDSPRVDQTGASPSADSGAIVRVTDRDLWYLSAFVENLFRIGKLSITPGVRIENIWQRIEENINTQRRPEAQKQYDFAPLFGLGIAYEVVKKIEVYTNISQSYRPKVFTQSIPTGAAQVVNENLEESKGVQYDFGIRGRPVPFVSFDIDYFILSFTNQIANAGNTVTNGGRSRTHGVEFFTDIDLVGAYDYFNKTDYADTFGSVKPFVTLTLLDAEFTAGSFEGRQPRYAPKYNLRVGTVYEWRDRVKVSLLSTFVDDHFGDDAGTVTFNIPSYKVWDLTAEVSLLKNVKNAFDLSIFGGINNIFDEHYFSRVNASGIDPAYGRNVYGGVKINLG